MRVFLCFLFLSFFCFTKTVQAAFQYKYYPRKIIHLKEPLTPSKVREILQSEDWRQGKTVSYRFAVVEKDLKNLQLLTGLKGVFLDDLSKLRDLNSLSKLAKLRILVLDMKKGSRLNLGGLKRCLKLRVLCFSLETKKQWENLTALTSKLKQLRSFEIVMKRNAKFQLENKHFKFLAKLTQLRQFVVTGKLKQKKIKDLNFFSKNKKLKYIWLKNFSELQDTSTLRTMSQLVQFERN